VCRDGCLGQFSHRYLLYMNEYTIDATTKYHMQDVPPFHNLFFDCSINMEEEHTDAKKMQD